MDEERWRFTLTVDIEVTLEDSDNGPENVAKHMEDDIINKLSEFGHADITTTMKEQ